MKAIVLSSGGIDSTTCLGIAVNELGKDNVTALSVYYGQRHTKELECAKAVAEYYGVNQKVIDLTQIFKDAKSCSLLSNSNLAIPYGEYSEQIKENGKLSTYVPFRNGLILASAAAIAQSVYPHDYVRIYLGAHADDAAGDAYPDCRPDFTEHMTRAINIGTYNKVKCYYPFINMDKSDVVEVGLNLNVPYHLTWSCYEGGDIPCLKCGTCIDRIKAFENNGITDPIIKENK